MFNRLINRYENTVLEPVTAPVLHEGTVTVFTYQNNLPWFLRVRNARRGWWRVSSRDNKNGRIEREADVSEVRNFLREAKTFFVIVARILDIDSAIVVPYMLADAEQRGWLQGRPRVAHLYRGRLQEFSVVRVAEAGDDLLFVDNRRTRNMTDRDTVQKIRELRAEDPFNFAENVHRLTRGTGFGIAAEVWEDAENRLRDEMRRNAIETLSRNENPEDNMLSQLEFSGVDSETVRINRRSGDRYVVSYTYNGMPVDGVEVYRTGQVISAPICLAGTDGYNNLASLVHVMEQARDENRYDLNRRYWR